jgi:hypothetical protein
MNNGNRWSADGQRRLKVTASNSKQRGEYRWMNVARSQQWWTENGLTAETSSSSGGRGDGIHVFDAATNR